MSIARSTLRKAVLLNNYSTRAFATSVAARKLVLPDLDYDFGALEPFISGQINELHYTKHHQTYVNGYNDATEKLEVARHDGNLRSQIELQPLINFHGGGHINHSLFWKNLAPQSAGGGEPPAAGSPLDLAINNYYGSLDKLIGNVNAKLAGVQGSGWAWIVKNKENGALDVITKPNQDPVTGPYVPIVGIDAWEHAYYLQYKNVKADYFKAIWNVVNWKEAEKRFSA
jgi:Fe-Mn family superoxide dismutase